VNSIYHAAFIVPQLEAAIAGYEAALGLRFRPPVSRHYQRLEQRYCDGPFYARFTYSVEGPMHIELVEVSGQGIWAQCDERVHHIGMWSPDPVAQAKKMAEVGFEWEASIHGDDGTVPIVFVRRREVRIELLNERRRPNFLDWVSGKRDAP
jgi:hypothetical protein